MPHDRAHDAMNMASLTGPTEMDQVPKPLPFNDETLREIQDSYLRIRKMVPHYTYRDVVGRLEAQARGEENTGDAQIRGWTQDQIRRLIEGISNN